jgi:hypothetical protein
VNQALGGGFSSIPPWAFGYNPYPNPLLTGGPVVAPYPYSPYGLSTVGGYGGGAGNPYGATLSTSGNGYSMSTVPYGSYGSPYSNPYGSYDPYSGYLQGVAAVTSATGQYYKDIQQARIYREQSRQMALDTERKRIELELWWEQVRPVAPRMIKAAQETDRDEARNYAPASKIWSGQALNVLLDSIIRSNRLKHGPNLPLDEYTLKRLNLTDRASRGNAGLLKAGKLHWPLVLQEEPFDKTRRQLELKLKDAVATLKEDLPLSAATLRDADALYKTLQDKLNDSVDDLSTGQYIEAKRYLSQVGDAIRALKSPNAAKQVGDRWKPRGKNVAELVANMRDEGLVFAPATEGDESAYNAMYQALRSFDAGAQGQPASSKLPE